MFANNFTLLESEDSSALRPNVANGSLLLSMRKGRAPPMELCCASPCPWRRAWVPLRCRSSPWSSGHSAPPMEAGVGLHFSGIPMAIRAPCPPSPPVVIPRRFQVRTS